MAEQYNGGQHVSQQASFIYEPEARDSPPQDASRLAAWLLPGLFWLVQLAGPIASEAATVWTGPVTNFTNVAGSDPTLPQNQDRLTAWGLDHPRREPGHLQCRDRDRIHP